MCNFYFLCHADRHTQIICYSFFFSLCPSTLIQLWSSWAVFMVIKRESKAAVDAEALLQLELLQGAAWGEKGGWSTIQKKRLLLAQRLVFLAKSCWLLRVMEPADLRRRNRGVQEKNMIFIYNIFEKNEMKKSGRSRMGEERQRGEKSLKVLVKMKTTFFICYYLYDPRVFTLTLALTGCLDETFRESLWFQPFRALTRFFPRINPLTFNLYVF